MSFATEIEAAAGEESIEAVIIGDFGGWSWGEEDEGASRRQAPVVKEKILSWGEARPMLDYDYDHGYGGVDCDSIYAYTSSKVIFVSYYDGASGVESIPRNPTEGNPNMFGGG